MRCLSRLRLLGDAAGLLRARRPWASCTLPPRPVRRQAQAAQIGTGTMANADVDTKLARIEEAVGKLSSDPMVRVDLAP